MAIKYHLVERGTPGSPEVPKKFYASTKSRGDISLRKLSQEITEMFTVSIVDTTVVIESLLQLIPRHLLNGEIVRLGDFGSFIVRVISRSADTEDDFSKALIDGVKLYFNPGKELKKELEQSEFERE